MTPVSHGKPCAGNPHARFEEGASAPETPRRNALLHNLGEVTYDGMHIPAVQVAQLCKDLGVAIDKMFSNTSVRRNCVRFMNWQPAICAEAFNNGDPEAVVLSGLYNPMR